MEKTDNTDRMSTEDLWKMVAESKNIYEDWNEISPYMDSFSFHEYLFQLAEQRSLNAAQLGKMALLLFISDTFGGTNTQKRHYIAHCGSVEP